MSQSAFIDNLNKELHKYICRVTIGNSKLLYTKLKRYPITECTDDYISMYNLISLFRAELNAWLTNSCALSLIKCDCAERKCNET